MIVSLSCFSFLSCRRVGLALSNIDALDSSQFWFLYDKDNKILSRAELGGTAIDWPRTLGAVEVKYTDYYTLERVVKFKCASDLRVFKDLVMKCRQQ